MNPRKAMTGMVLSGGKSLRMGQNKAFIELDGLPIIARIVSLLNQLFEETVIVTNEPEPYKQFNATIRCDLEPGYGALGGLQTGLIHASFDHAFCVACDMPFLRAPLIEFLTRDVNQGDVIVPRTSDGLQPLHAVYSKNCLGAIRTIINEKKVKIIEFYPLVRVRIVEERDFLFLDPSKESFTNINTPEDLRLIHRSQMA